MTNAFRWKIPSDPCAIEVSSPDISKLDCYLRAIEELGSSVVRSYAITEPRPDHDEYTLHMLAAGPAQVTELQDRANLNYLLGRLGLE